MTTSTKTRRIIGVRFRRAEPLSYYDPADLEIKAGDLVVVDTPLGPDVGEVVLAPGSVVHRDEMLPVRPSMRIATQEDLDNRERLTLREAEAVVLAKAKARNMSLPMKFSRARFSLDERKVALEFTADERLELRDLYRSLGDALHARVELRSIGPRDEAKNLGALGRCGYVLCCASWLVKFESISVRMAKEQALPSSADGLAGQCGRLKCCLRFEYEQYRAVNKMLPKVGERIMTEGGPAKVIVGHPLRETVSVILEQRGPDDFVRTMEYGLADIERLPRHDSRN